MKIQKAWKLKLVEQLLDSQLLLCSSSTLGKLKRSFSSLQMLNDHSHPCHKLTSCLQLFERKTFASSDLHVVLDDLSMDKRPERSNRGPWENLNCLLLASCTSSCLPCWLIEPCLDIVLSVLTEVSVRDDTIVLHHGYGRYDDL